MFGFKTVSCLHDIPVIRASTDNLQNVYTKAKKSTVLIGLPCSIAETVADTSIRVTLTALSPVLTPLLAPARAIDGFAARKIRQMGCQYPVINTSAEDVVNTFNEKTEPVRNAVNSVKGTTTSTIQQGKETVSNVASATIITAAGVAGSLYSYCESYVPDMQRRNSGKPAGLSGFAFATIFALLEYAFQSVQSSLIWFRMLLVFVLLKSKQINDFVLNKVQRKPYLPVLPQRLLVIVGAFLEYFVRQIRPDDRTLAELRKSKSQQSRHNQQTHSNQQPQPFANRPNFKPDPSVRTHQNVVYTKPEMGFARTSDGQRIHQSDPDYSHLTDTEELRARIGNGDLDRSDYNVDNDEYFNESASRVPNGDVNELHDRVNATDIELLYSGIPNDILPGTDEQGTLTVDQQQLHARFFGTDIERQLRHDD